MQSSIATILALMLRRKLAIKMYFVFPPHLICVFALPGETGNPEIASFHLNAACFVTKKTRNTVKNITWSELNHHSLSERSSGCTRQDLGREHSILLSVTHMLCVSLSRCRSLCKRWESFFVKPGVKKSIDNINEISYYLKKCYTL